MLSAIISILRVSTMEYSTFLHIMVPLMIMETAIDLVLINWIVDKIEIRDRENGKELPLEF